MAWPFADRWDQAQTFDQFIETNPHAPNIELWKAVHRLARVPEGAAEDARSLGGRYRLVVLSEDWCGDAVNTIPVLAKWAAEAGNIELRLLSRDGNPDIMDRYLTGTARSIPVVIALTEQMEELGWWGPRPRELQQWVMEQRAAGVDKKTLYPEIRKWYARDKGKVTISEVKELLGGKG